MLTPLIANSCNKNNDGPPPTSNTNIGQIIENYIQTKLENPKQFVIGPGTGVFDVKVNVTESDQKSQTTPAYCENWFKKYATFKDNPDGATTTGTIDSATILKLIETNPNNSLGYLNFQGLGPLSQYKASIYLNLQITATFQGTEKAKNINYNKTLGSNIELDPKTTFTGLTCVVGKLFLEDKSRSSINDDSQLVKWLNLDNFSNVYKAEWNNGENSLCLFNAKTGITEFNPVQSQKYLPKKPDTPNNQYYSFCPPGTSESPNYGVHSITYQDGETYNITGYWRFDVVIQMNIGKYVGHCLQIPQINGKNQRWTP